jgi:hypothetical protein
MKPSAMLVPAALAAAFLHAAAAQPAASSTAPASAPPAAEAGRSAVAEPGVSGQTVTVQATVESVDVEGRTVHLKTDDGRVAAVRVGPDVGAFDGIRPGDQVTATFTEAIVLSVVRNGETQQRVESQASSETAAGQRPGLGTTSRTTVVADVAELDRQQGRLVLRGPGDRLLELRVQDPQVLEGLSPDDRVVANFVEASALSIGPAQSGGGVAAGIATSPAAGTAQQDEAMQRLVQASDRLRDAITAMAQAPADQANRAAARDARQALLDTQLALMALPDDAATTTPAAGTSGDSLKQLQAAAERLRGTIQALADRPEGAERNQAMAKASQALLDTQQALLTHLGNP